MLHWGLTGAALLLFLYAVRLLFLSSRGTSNEAQQKLGCGFALAAALLWTYVIDHYFGRPWGAIRIGLGLLLVLPAVQALAKPERARILSAAIAVILAAVVAGPPLQEMWEKYGLDTRDPEVTELADRIAELEALQQELEQRRDSLQKLRGEVKAEIQAARASWSEIESDQALLERLEVLRRIDEEKARTDAGLAQIQARLPDLREAFAASADGGSLEPSGGSELDPLLKELEDAPSLEELSIVEQELRKQELRVLYEREF